MNLSGSTALKTLGVAAIYIIVLIIAGMLIAGCSTTEKASKPKGEKLSESTTMHDPGEIRGTPWVRRHDDSSKVYITIKRGVKGTDLLQVWRIHDDQSVKCAMYPSAVTWVGEGYKQKRSGDVWEMVARNGTLYVTFPGGIRQTFEPGRIEPAVRCETKSRGVQ